MKAHPSIRVWLAASCAAAFALGAANAAEISVNVRDDQGAIVDDAVVILKPRSGDAVNSPARRMQEGSFEIVQKNLSFLPHTLVVPRGATVAFPNQDVVRHHVYSFSPARKFELALYGQEESRTVTFNNPGIVAIGCNIHDSMQAYVFIYDAGEEAKLSEQGLANFGDLPEGEYSISVWHPRMKRQEDAVEQIVRAGGDVSYSATIKIPLRPAHRPARTSYN